MIKRSKSKKSSSINSSISSNAMNSVDTTIETSKPIDAADPIRILNNTSSMIAKHHHRYRFSKASELPKLSTDFSKLENCVLNGAKLKDGSRSSSTATKKVTDFSINYEEIHHRQHHLDDRKLSNGLSEDHGHLVTSSKPSTAHISSFDDKCIYSVPNKGKYRTTAKCSNGAGGGTVHSIRE
ncbi:hypothetical protein QR98_0026910 [Sarcoptes scabiei]|uniref:Uncharacterized protein n=1 Tax=Sarcoptes scabiei TaxID=52283 RepID=A0A131ZZF5_SARSC|nr:hypothetical protein QR98_0026910 [Sarcoptes scabiei]